MVKTTTLQAALSGGPVRAMIDAEVARQVDAALAGRVKQMALTEARRFVKGLRPATASRPLLESAARSDPESRSDAHRRWEALIPTPAERPGSSALALLESLSGPREQAAPRQPAWQAQMMRAGVSQATVEALGGALLEAPKVDDAEDKADGGKDEATEDALTVRCGICRKKVQPKASSGHPPRRRCPSCGTDLSQAIANAKKAPGGAR